MSLPRNWTTNKYGARPLWLCLECGRTEHPIAGRKFKCCDQKMQFFASLREFEFYHELRIRERLGDIVDLVLQPKYPIVINGQTCGRCTPDFSYVEDGKLRVIDVKGRDTDPFRRRVAEALHGIKIDIVR